MNLIRNQMMRKILTCFSIILLSGYLLPVQAQVSKFQALYLLNFSKNFDWDQENVVIGVVGKTSIWAELETLAAKYPTISIKRVSVGESLSDCQLVFLPTSQKKNFAAIQGQIGKAPIVLVSEDENLAKEGAEVGFYLEGNRLKFTINQSALRESTVTANDKLLSVARLIN